MPVKRQILKKLAPFSAIKQKLSSNHHQEEDRHNLWGTGPSWTNALHYTGASEMALAAWGMFDNGPLMANPIQQLGPLGACNSGIDRTQEWQTTTKMGPQGRQLRNSNIYLCACLACITGGLPQLRKSAWWQVTCQYWAVQPLRILGTCFLQFKVRTIQWAR